MTNFDAMPDTSHIDVKGVSEMLGVSKATVWRMVSANKIPQPKRFSARCSRWEMGPLRVATGCASQK